MYILPAASCSGILWPSGFADIWIKSEIYIGTPFGRVGTYTEYIKTIWKISNFLYLLAFRFEKLPPKSKSENEKL